MAGRADLCLGSVAILFALEGFVGDPLWTKFEPGGFHRSGTLQTTEFSAGAFLAGVVLFTVGAVVLRRTGGAVASYLGRTIGPLSAKLADGVNSKVLAFADGL